MFSFSFLTHIYIIAFELLKSYLLVFILFQVKKFMVGYEMLAQSQRDLTAEQVH